MPPRMRRKPPEKPVDTRKAIMNILGLLSDYKLRLAVTIICAVISTLFSVIAPLLIGRATTLIFDGINKLMQHTGTIDFNTLLNLLTIVVILYIVSAVFSYLQSYFLVEISTKISYNLRERLLEKVTHLPMGSFDNNQRGDISAWNYTGFHPAYNSDYHNHRSSCDDALYKYLSCFDNPCIDSNRILCHPFHYK